jgi:hypothetical protein
MAHGSGLFSVSSLADSLNLEMDQDEDINIETSGSSGDVLDYGSGSCFLHVSNYLLIYLQSPGSFRGNHISNETNSETIGCYRTFA